MTVPLQKEEHCQTVSVAQRNLCGPCTPFRGDVAASHKHYAKKCSYANPYPRYILR